MSRKTTIFPIAKTEEVNGITVKTELYRILEDLVVRFHPEIASAQIGLAWHQGWGPTPEGRVRLGQTVLCPALHKQYHGLDAILLLNGQIWNDPEISPHHIAILDHFLCWIQPKRDKEGDIVLDDGGKEVFTKVAPEINEFLTIIERYGATYLPDLEKAAALIISRAEYEKRQGGSSSGGDELDMERDLD